MATRARPCIRKLRRVWDVTSVQDDGVCEEALPQACGNFAIARQEFIVLAEVMVSSICVSSRLLKKAFYIYIYVCMYKRSKS